MTLAPQHYTATMAGLYAAQGYLEKAAEVYRYLLDSAPGSQDLSAALSEVEARMKREKQTPDRREGEGEKRAETDMELKMLLEEWIGLLLEMNKISALKKHRQVMKQT